MKREAKVFFCYGLLTGETMESEYGNVPDFSYQFLQFGLQITAFYPTRLSS